MFNDDILRGLYVKYDVTCDKLVCNPQLMSKFAADYTAISSHVVEPSELSHHLLNIRKRGEANGGLPRLLRN